jgi:hypothetical protein
VPVNIDYLHERFPPKISSHQSLHHCLDVPRQGVNSRLAILWAMCDKHLTNADGTPPSRNTTVRKQRILKVAGKKTSNSTAHSFDGFAAIPWLPTSNRLRIEGWPYKQTGISSSVAAPAC